MPLWLLLPACITGAFVFSVAVFTVMFAVFKGHEFDSPWWWKA